MAATDAQISCLADSPSFQNACRAAIVKIAAQILNGTSGQYTTPQISRARTLVVTQTFQGYYLALAASTNVVASNITFDFVNRVAISDISDADLDSQVLTTVFGYTLPI